jgi:hypothetical protein
MRTPSNSFCPSVETLEDRNVLSPVVTNEILIGPANQITALDLHLSDPVSVTAVTQSSYFVDGVTLKGAVQILPLLSPVLAGSQDVILNFVKPFNLASFGSFKILVFGPVVGNVNETINLQVVIGNPIQIPTNTGGLTLGTSGSPDLTSTQIARGQLPPGSVEAIVGLDVEIGSTATDVNDAAKEVWVPGNGRVLTGHGLGLIDIGRLVLNHNHARLPPNFVVGQTVVNPFAPPLLLS